MVCVLSVVDLFVGVGVPVSLRDIDTILDLILHMVFRNSILYDLPFDLAYGFPKFDPV